MPTASSNLLLCLTAHTFAAACQSRFARNHSAYINVSIINLTPRTIELTTTTAVMGDVIDQPVQAPKKKKKALAFLRSTPKPEPSFNDDFDPTKVAVDKAEEEEDDEDSLNMFKRSKDFWPQLKREENPLRRATPQPKLDSPKNTIEDGENEARSSKKRKVSNDWIPETYDDLYGPPSPPRRSSRPINQSSPALVAPIEQASPFTGKNKGKGKELARRDWSQTPSPQANSHQLPVGAEQLDNGEDFPKEGMRRDRRTSDATKVKPESPSTRKRSASPILLEDSSDDDLLDTGPEAAEDPLAHFVTAARKRHEDAAKAAAAAAADASSDDDAEPLSPNEAQARRKKNAPFIPVAVYVSARIAAHTHPTQQTFGSKRKATQGLGPVRNAFVQFLQKHGTYVSPEMEKDIFLTWKGRRIYTSVSIVGLGVVVKANGRIDAPDRAPGYDQGGVLLEGWTTEDFDRHTAEEEQKRLVNRGEALEEGGGAGFDDEEDDEEPEPQVAKIRLFLQEKDKEALGLSAYADTQLKVLIGAYQRTKKVPQDQEIRLNFDGEWLDPSMTVEQADIEDHCTVDVYLK